MSPAPTLTPRTAARRRRGRFARRWLWRGRWLLVALCCGIAASSTVQVLRPAPPPMRSVVVPTHRLEPGVELRAGDLTVVSVPAALAPDGALTDTADAVGRVPAVALEAGLPLSASLVAGGEVAALAPTGTVVVPVRLDDATAALLRAGDRVDLVSTASLDPEAAYLARRVLVLTPGSRAAEGGGASGLLGGAVSDAPVVTLVAVSPAEAPGLSAASGAGTVAAVLVR
ncbi:SAF domain protein [Xylanimonas cellulosilytica DSM 15894]|uniref:SAF domain protein n=1 Tax=Xylanimonas cellulosilytica (strain DSM 15894 / JCM 12276 / CECT 5975 / KCTC 9989 / LMG 20990 / NBRC 107835 / XIL07) TaxID=446471 RepID=D1BYF8_XYLCX|nr:SAF domain-containing protein [Xylanimonas cellulosilytica]ACZ31830.1 SAF domain protein [Xylanimonas cellulosilytica DSM 15894]